MTKSNVISRRLRFAFLSLAATLFAVSGFFFNFQTAQMQTGTSRIVFERYDSRTGVTKIFTAKTDGTNEIELGEGFLPVYSPDGSKIAFVNGNGETSDIFVMNADGSQKTKLTDGGYNVSPSFSPDGTRIAYVSDENGFHIFLMQADGTGKNQLDLGRDSDISGEYYPVWSADGSKIIFCGTSARNGGDDYYAADANNSGAVTQLTFLNVYLYRPRAAVAPNGTSIVFEHNDDLYSAPTDGSGTLTNLTNTATVNEEFPAFSPNSGKIIFTRNGSGSIFRMNANGSSAVDLNVEGRYASWNPSAIMTME
ncbi:MAG TPA: hypothetical protein VEQ34_06810 [Pyrinomonadaceae bacterium]|nr:hypothetical protein [Pyrinomonadaceae bacterium]